MAWLVVQGRERRVSVRSGALVVETRGEPIQVLRPEEVEEVHVFGDVQISAAARRLLLLKGIDAVFYTMDGRVRGRLSSAEHRSGERRLAQLRSVLDQERRATVARAVVAGKIRNQHTVLGRIQRRVRLEVVADALSSLRAAARRAERATDIERLRGIEGLAARVYFEAFSAGVANPLFSFHGRNRRPPRDPVNAVLSFLYTLLCQRTEHAARGAGLDVFVGFLHDAGRGHAACAFDLAEEWRPVVDALVLGLFNRRQLSPEDFMNPRVDLGDVGAPPAEGEQAPPRAVHLGPVGRGIVIAAWTRRLRNRVYDPRTRARHTIEDLLRMQAQQLARVCADPSAVYQPFRWR